MKVVILCGGKGTRISEETATRPKPMIEIGGKPILWHIQSIYAKYGFNDFILALGYKGEIIKDYFLKFHALNSDFQIELKNGEVSSLRPANMNWKVSLVDTGHDSMTGGRLLRLKPYLSESDFFLTYGDGVSNVDVRKLMEFHQGHGKIATVTAVRPPARFGEMYLQENTVTSFEEKPRASVGWINGGFFVFKPQIFKYLQNDETILEKSPLETLARENQLQAYKHEGFWQCMDTLRDKIYLDALCESREVPWL